MPESILSRLWVIVSDDASVGMAAWPDDKGNKVAAFFTSRESALEFLKSSCATTLRVDSMLMAEAMESIYNLLESSPTACYALDPPDPRHIGSLNAAEFLTTMIRLAEEHGQRYG